MRKLVLLALSLLGLFDSAYLWWVYASPSNPMVCLGTGCDVVRDSSYANLWSLPLPAYGAAMYAALVFLAFAEPLLSGPLQRAARFAVAGIAGVGFVVSMYLSGVEAFVLHAWCAWCVVSALAVTFIAVLAVLDLVRPAPYAEPARAITLLRENLAVLVAALVVGIPAFFFLSRPQASSPAPSVPEEIWNEHLVRPDSHMTGNLQAQLTVVEFADFQCSACGMAEKSTREVREKFGGQVRFVFRHMPFSRIHAYAEKAAEASECAAEQGKFWEAAEKFFAGQNDLSEPALTRYAAELGLQAGRFNQCLASGAMAARVRRDLEDGRALGVTKTPTFFVGRTRIEGPLDVAKFAQLLDQETAGRGGTASASQGQKSGTPSDPAKTSLSPKGAFGESATNVFSRLGSSATACSEEEALKYQPVLIRTPEVRAIFERGPKAVFADVRASKDFGTGRIPGAINLPIEDFERSWSRLPRDKNIVLYESGLAPGDVCASSRAAGRVLLAHGFPAERVKVYQDGLAAWQKAGMPVER